MLRATHDEAAGLDWLDVFSFVCHGKQGGEIFSCCSESVYVEGSQYIRCFDP